MKQIVHILRKDLEHLWPVCLQVWVLVILHAFYLTHFAHPGAGFEIRGPWGVLGLFASLSGLMWPLALAAMTVVLIQQEPLTGSSAFWLTRPYSRVALVTEKVVFVSLCGLAPLVIHYTFAVAWFGFASAAAVPVIAFETCEFAAVLACVAAMAVLTHNFARFTAIASGVIVASWLLVALIDHDIGNGGLLTGVPGLAAAVTAAKGAVLVVMHQYKTRRTIANATIGAVSVIAALLVLTHFPWRLAWALHDRIEAPSSGLEQVQLTPILDASDAFLPIDPTGKSTMPVGQSISYPFQVARLTKGTSLEAFRAVGDLKIGSRSFHLYPLILPSFRSSTLTAPINKTSAIFSVGPEDILDRYREMSAMLQGSFYFQAYRDLPQRNIPLSQRDITVGVGREKCVVESHLDQQGELHVGLDCAELEPASGLRIDVSVVDSTGVVLWKPVGSRSAIGATGRSLFPGMFNPVHLQGADYSFQRPGTQDAFPESASVVLKPREPAGLLRRDFRINSSKLRDIETESRQRVGTAGFPRRP